LIPKVLSFSSTVAVIDMTPHHCVCACSRSSVEENSAGILHSWKKTRSDSAWQTLWKEPLKK